MLSIVELAQGGALEGVCLMEVPRVCIAKHAPHHPSLTIRHPKAERAGLCDVTHNNMRGAGRLSQAQVEERVTRAVVLHDGDMHAQCTEWVDAWMHGWMDRCSDDLGGCMNGWMDGRMDGWMRMDGCADGWVDA